MRAVLCDVEIEKTFNSVHSHAIFNDVAVRSGNRVVITAAAGSAASGEPFAQAARTRLATMIALAAIERIFLLLPLDCLWTRQRAPRCPRLAAHVLAASPTKTLPLRP